MTTQKLLSRSNPKLEKNTKYGWTSFGLHLAPYTLGGKNICPNASSGCIKACLFSSGMGAYPRVQQARIKKTRFFHENREAFLRQLYKEINAKVNTAAKKGELVSFRLNLTSDVAWETVKLDGKTFMEHFPTVQFYDYTPNLKRVMNFLMGKFPSNYHLTFSRKEDNQDRVNIVLGNGGNVAVVFDKRLPAKYKGKKVIDATKHDLRFIDPKNTIAGLVALGKGRKDSSGFVVDTKRYKNFLEA
jgi:hypothetical protein